VQAEILAGENRIQEVIEGMPLAGDGRMSDACLAPLEPAFGKR
jgi:hypothetical protein